MNLSKNLKKILISSAALLMTGSIIGTGNVANAKHRRYHYRYTRRARRNVYKYGYYKHGRYHYYKTGYFRNGKWIKRATKSHKRATKSHKHAKYMWMGYDLPDGTHYARVRITGKQYPVGKTNDPDGYQYTFYTNDRSYIDNVGGSKKGIGWANGFHNYNPATASHHNSNDSSNDVTTSVHHSHTNSTAKNLAEMKSQTIADINNDRENNGLYPYQESSELDNIAHMRAKQIQKVFEHKDPNTGINYYAEDAQKLGYHNIPNKTLDENIASSALNIEEMRKDGTSYYDNNGKEAANDMDNTMVNHDGPRWGHRHNILDTNAHYIGVGTAYKNGTYSLAEDFK